MQNNCQSKLYEQGFVKVKNLINIKRYINTNKNEIKSYI